jgi:hypothetical protein
MRAPHHFAGSANHGKTIEKSPHPANSKKPQLEHIITTPAHFTA